MKIEFSDGRGVIGYVYNAAGVKLQKKVTENGITKTTDYAGGFIYEDSRLKYFATAEGRMVNDAVKGLQYEYHYKDHLGNVRMTYAPVREPDAKLTLTMELANEQQEQQAFSNVSSSTRTDGGYNNSSLHSARLNAGTGNIVSKGIAVKKGEKITATVYAICLDANGNPLPGGNVQVPPTEAVSTTSTQSDLAVVAPLFGISTPQGSVMTEAGKVTPPALRVNALAFLPLLKKIVGKVKARKDEEVLPTFTNPPACSQPGFITIELYSDAACTNRISQRPIAVGSTSWQQFMDTMTVEQDGFVKVTIGNTSRDVFTGFDELVITHRKNETAEIIQENHYEPFGMTLQGLDFVHQAQVGKENRFLYNGKEKTTELGLQMYEYGARMYDAQVGRFHVVDRFAEKYMGLTPYQYAANDPVKMIDVNGDSIFIRHNGETIFYNPTDGKLYNGRLNEDGTRDLYNGRAVIKRGKRAGQLKDGFVKNTLNALERIRTGGKAGAALINRVHSKSAATIIHNKSEGDNTSSGTFIYWNPYNDNGGIDMNGESTRPAFIGLAHELAHTWDWLDGAAPRERENWFTTSDGQERSKAEWSATHWENMIRAENGISLRRFYAQNAQVGAILIGNTTQSMFYSREVFSLDAGGNLIKSVQHYDYLNPQGDANSFKEQQ